VAANIINWCWAVEVLLRDRSTPGLLIGTGYIWNNRDQWLTGAAILQPGAKDWVKSKMSNRYKSPAFQFTVGKVYIPNCLV